MYVYVYYFTFVYLLYVYVPLLYVSYCMFKYLIVCLSIYCMFMYLILFVYLILCLSIFIYVYVSFVCLCIFIFMYLYCMFMYLHRTNWHSSATLTEVFPCFFLICKQMPGYNSQRRGTANTLANLLLFVSFCVLSVCKCVLYYCYRVATQLQFNKCIISYHIIFTIYCCSVMEA
jgi:hypothetical protein